MGRKISAWLLLALMVGIALGYAADDVNDSESGAEVHKSIDCANCHSLLDSSADSGPMKPKTEVCRDCHSLETSGGEGWSSLFHKDESRSCADCHSFHNPTTIKTLDGELSITDDQLTAFICQTCHLPGQRLDQVSESHRKAAAEYYHSDRTDLAGESPSEVCLNCHSDHGSYYFADQLPAIQIDLSASHSLGVDVRQLDPKKRQTEIDPKIRLLENRIECQSCHSLSSGTKDALVGYDNPYDLCYGCHAIRG